MTEAQPACDEWTFPSLSFSFLRNSGKFIFNIISFSGEITVKNSKAPDETPRYLQNDAMLIHVKIRSFQPQAIICGCEARFVSDLVGNHDDRFSHDAAHIVEDRQPLSDGSRQSF